MYENVPNRLLIPFTEYNELKYGRFETEKGFLAIANSADIRRYIDTYIVVMKQTYAKRDNQASLSMRAICLCFSLHVHTISLYDFLKNCRTDMAKKVLNGWRGCVINS